MDVAHRNPTDSRKFFASPGTNILDHLAADTACLTGSQVTVVTVGQLDADLGSLMSILNLSMASRDKGNVPLTQVLSTHCDFSPSIVFRKARRFHLENDFFLSASPSLTKVGFHMNGE